MPTSPTTPDGVGTAMADLPADVLSHILRLLDGPSLASAAAASPHIYSLSHPLWRTLSHAAWPSTAHPHFAALALPSFPHSYRSFFSDSFPLLLPDPSPLPPSVPPPDRLISAVDLRLGGVDGGLLFSKVVETETRSDWFLSTPFRVDALDRTESPPSFKSAPPVMPFDGDLSLSWVVVDPARGRAADFSSSRPVSVQRHWLSGEIQVRFATVMGESEGVQVGIVVACEGGGEGGDVRVKEVSLQVEDADGMSLNGRESLAVLQGAMEGRRRRRPGAVEEAAEERRRYSEFVERKRERKEKKTRRERRVDMACVITSVFLFATFCGLVLFR